MENLHQVADRVDGYCFKRLLRLGCLVGETSVDPRNPQGVRHPFVDCVLSLIAGIIAGRKAFRDVEQLSYDLGLGRCGQGVSDGALTHLLGLCGERDFDALLVRTVKDMGRRGELTHPGLDRPWVSIDGKYMILDHHCGGLGQKFTGDGSVYWRVGVLRAVLISTPSRPALGQWPMGPVQTTETDPEKIKHTGEITNLPPFARQLQDQYGDLASNLVLDAGLWSKDLFLSLDQSGFGLVCGLKKNKPDLFAEVVRVLNVERERRSPDAVSNWESYRNGWIRRRIWRTRRLEGWNGWTHLRQAAVVEQTTVDADGKESVELRYFVSNATTGMLSPTQFLQVIRQHWSIENDCNWTFDLQFGEDDRAWCTKNKAVLVLGVLRMIAYNLLQHLRKSHVQVPGPAACQRPAPPRPGRRRTIPKHIEDDLAATPRVAKPSPRPWRNLYELTLQVLRGMGTRLGEELRKAARRAGARVPPPPLQPVCA